MRKMEYIGKCPECGKNAIIYSNRKIQPKNGRLQRMVKCPNHVKTQIMTENGIVRQLSKRQAVRMTIIGVIRFGLLNYNALVIKWL